MSRTHHDEMTKTLTQLALQDPDRFEKNFTDDDAALRGLWGRLGQRLHRDERVPSRGLAVTWYEGDDSDAVVITLPTPVANGDAWFLLYLPGDPPRFFALELADDGTALAELGDDRDDLGPGPAPGLEAFAEAALSAAFGG